MTQGDRIPPSYRGAPHERAPHSMKGLGHEDNIDNNNDQLWEVDEGDFAVHAGVYGEV